MSGAANYWPNVVAQCLVMAVRSSLSQTWRHGGELSLKSLKSWKLGGMSASGAWPMEARTGVSGVLVCTPRIMKGYIFSRPVSSPDIVTNCLDAWFLSNVGYNKYNEINLTIAILCAAIRNCCTAFSYELRGCAAVQLKGNIAYNSVLGRCKYQNSVCRQAHVLPGCCVSYTPDFCIFSLAVRGLGHGLAFSRLNDD